MTDHPLHHRPEQAPLRTSLDMAQRLMAAGGVKNIRRTLGFEPSFWMRCRLADLDCRAINDRLPACPHLTGDQVGIVALWAPTGVWCLTCAATETPLEGDANYTCDRCGTVSADVTAMTVVSRRMLVMLGLCRDCRAREEGRVE